MTNYLTPTGECGCKKPNYHGEPQGSMETRLHFATRIYIEVLAQSRFHAEAIRETVEKMWDLLEQEEGMTEYFEKQKRTFDAVLKCMLQSPSGSSHDPKHKVSDMEGKV